MRPPEFTGGNGGYLLRVADAIPASMRPPEFTGGNQPRRPRYRHRCQSCFNEAAGIHRRKHADAR